MTTPNIRALYEAIWDIEDNPEGWNQSVFGCQTACGTFGCLAYRICKRDGQEFAAWPCGDLYVKTPDGTMAISTAATEILGIKFTESLHMFSSENNLEDLYSAASYIASRYALPIPSRSQPGMKGH